MQLTTNSKITKTVAVRINAAAEQQAGRRKVRTLSQADVTRFIELLRKHRRTATNIRVYSADGFVPNSYKYRADIDYIDGVRDEHGVWRVNVATTDAKRNHGRAALATVDRKGVE